MPKYVILRLMRFLYEAIAAVIAIFSIVAVAYLVTEAFLNDTGIDVVRGLSYLVFGFLGALTFFVLAQLIRIMVDTYTSNQALAKELERANKLNMQMLKILNAHTRMLRALHHDDYQDEQEIIVKTQDFLDFDSK